MKDIEKHFPDANYYTAGGGLNVMLGAAHNFDDETPQQELIALSASGNLAISDGDF